MQIQIESSATVSASSLLAYCDHSATVLDLYTGLKWIYSGNAWVVYTGIGPQGPQGTTGSQGAQGSIGSQGPQGSQGSAGADGGNYKTTSASNVTMGTGTKSFTVAAGLSYSLDQRVVMANSTTKYMYGRVTSYSGTTLQVSVDFTTDTSVSYSSWTINLMGERGTVLSATSSTSKVMATGSITITATTLCSFVTGQRINVAYDSSNYMSGIVNTYLPTTGSLTFTCDMVVGSGTYSSWSISVVGATGIQGASGPQGNQGAVGPQGSSGPQGASGAQGTQGSNGTNGAQGPQGAQGTSIMNITISTSAPSGSGNEGDIWVVVPA